MKFYYVLSMGIFCTFASAVDQDSKGQLDIFKKKPYGPFYCKSRCVASCLDLEDGANMSKCEEFCHRFEDSMLCEENDLTCWQNCGTETVQDESSDPSPVQNVQADFQSINDTSDPYRMLIEWDPSDDAKLYVLEIFPIRSAFAKMEKDIVQMMTMESSYLFQRPDMCEVYLARVMAVNAFALSTPSYRRLNALSPPSDDINLQFTVESITNDTYGVHVLLAFETPQSWINGGLEFHRSFVKATDCNGPVRSSIFMDADKPDEDGYYWPMVSINDTAPGLVDLWFPNHVVNAECVMIFKVSSLKTDCGANIALDTDGEKNGADFALNCRIMKVATCFASDQDEPKSIDTEDTSKASDQGQPETDMNILPSPLSSQLENSKDKSKLAIDPIPDDSVYDDAFKGSQIRPLDSDEKPDQGAPPAPWIEKDEKEYMSVLDEFVEGIAEGTDEKQTDSTSTLPPAPLFPTESTEISDRDPSDFDFPQTPWVMATKGPAQSSEPKSITPYLSLLEGKESLHQSQPDKDQVKIFWATRLVIGLIFVALTIGLVITLIALAVFIARRRDKPMYKVFTNV